MKPEIELIPHREAICSDQPTTLQLLVRITPPVVSDMPRPDMAIGVALDRSGSMDGKPLEEAKDASKMLVDELEADDRLALVAFDHYAQIVLGMNKALSARKMKKQISKLQSGGYTDLHSGWLETCRQLVLPAADGKSKRVIILSDGETNSGLTCEKSICEQVQEWRSQGVSTSAVGLGLSYNENLLSAIATAGGGNFSHAESADAIEPFFAAEFQGLALTYGEQVDVSVELSSGVKAVRVYNKLKNREDGSLGLTDLVLGYAKEIVFELSLPAMQSGQDLCTFHLNYKDKQTGRYCRVSKTLTLPAVTYPQLIEFPYNMDVLAKKNIQLAARALDKARKHIAAHNTAEAKRVLQEAVVVLQETPPTEEVLGQQREIKSLIKLLDERKYQSVAKRATATSSSISNSSITLAGSPIAEWIKLSPEERTPERLQQILRDMGQAS